MKNDNEVEVITTENNNNEVETNEVETTEEETTSKPEVKKNSETLEAREARLARQLEQTRKKLGKSTETQERTSTNSNDLGEKAYLIANGIKSADEMAFVKKMKKETGKDIESLLETTYFQAEFKDFKEKKATANAIPTASQRSNNSSIDTVEYWIAKGELPPSSEIELRRKVVNARMKKEESKGIFYNG
jgi:predicted nuclease with TOPRIM domain